MKKALIIIGIIVCIVAVAFIVRYAQRLRSVASIEQLTNYDDYNLYQIDIDYEYDLDRILAHDIHDDASCVRALMDETFPWLKVDMELPNFGCSAFTLNDSTTHVCMGRNYDFRLNTSCMIVRCAPKNGYRSVALAALDNIHADKANESFSSKLSCLVTPFVCLDGINEKGVAIAVLTLDSDPTHQTDSTKRTIGTSLAIRLVLDRAATTQEAVDLLRQYNMLANNGRDYHFYISDASGDGRVIEWDCLKPERPMLDVPMVAITNFFAAYKDSVLPHQRNGIYGHGKERYETICNVLEQSAKPYSYETAWTALKGASQAYDPNSVTSNTQWSVIYDLNDLSAQLVLRRRWDEVIKINFNRE